MVDWLKVAIKVSKVPRDLIAKARKAKASRLKRAGAIVRGIMRRSIKYKAQGASPVGTPPHSHVKSGGIKNLIFFAYDEATQTVAIGPTLDSQAEPNIEPTPGILERGGRSRIRLSRKAQKASGKTHTIAHVRPRPFAGPALEKFQTSYPDLWRDSIQ